MRRISVPSPPSSRRMAQGMMSRSARSTSASYAYHPYKPPPSMQRLHRQSATFPSNPPATGFCSQPIPLPMERLHGQSASVLSSPPATGFYRQPTMSAHSMATASATQRRKLQDVTAHNGYGVRNWLGGSDFKLEQPYTPYAGDDRSSLSYDTADEYDDRFTASEGLHLQNDGSDASLESSISDEDPSVATTFPRGRIDISKIGRELVAKQSDYGSEAAIERYLRGALHHRKVKCCGAIRKLFHADGSCAENALEEISHFCVGMTAVTNHLLEETAALKREVKQLKRDRDRDATSENVPLNCSAANFNGLAHVSIKSEGEDAVDLVSMGMRLRGSAGKTGEEQLKRFIRDILRKVFKNTAGAFTGSGNSNRGYRIVPEDIEEQIKGALYTAAALPVAVRDGKFVFKYVPEMAVVDAIYQDQSVLFFNRARRSTIKDTTT